MLLSRGVNNGDSEIVSCYRSYLDLYAPRRAAATALIANVLCSQRLSAQELTEITVTATRMAEDINRVPLSITAFTAQQMDEKHLINIDDISAQTPGLQFHHVGGPNVTEISVRGIQSNIGDGTTGVYIDDTPVQIRKAGLSFTATNTYPQLFDFDRVEVLRGPQGTLFGSGSMGGALRFITTAPDLNKFSVYTRDEASFTAHGDPNMEVSAAAGGPILEDVLGFRISARFRREGGFIDHEARADIVQTQTSGGESPTGIVDRNSNWQNAASLRVALTYAPAPGLQISPSVYYQDVRVNSSGRFWDGFSRPGDGSFLNGDAVNSPFQDRWSLSALNVKYDVGSVSLISNTSYFDRNNTNYYDCTTCILQLSPLGPQLLTPQQFLPNLPRFAEQAHDLNQQINWTQEIRAQSNDATARATWVVGAFVQNAKSTNQDFVPLDASTFTQVSQALGALQNPPLSFGSYADLFYGAGLINNQQTYQTLDLVRERQVAVFGDLTYALIPGVKVTGGVRTTHFSLQATSLQGGPFAGTSDLEGFSAGQTETATTPRGSLSWQVTDGSMIYTTVAKGFRGGGVNQPLPSACGAALGSVGLAAAPDQYKSDSLVSYEVGSKNRLFDDRLDVSASVFYIKWKNIQQSEYLGLGCNRSVTLNANNATSKGFDIQGTWAASRAVTLNGSVSFTKATYDEALVGSPDPLTGERPIVINKGNTLEGVVPWELTLGAAYTATLLSHEGTLRLDYQYTSRQGERAPEQDAATTSFLPYSRFIPQVSQLNARYGMKFGNAELAIFMNNVLDAHPAIQDSPGDQFNSVTQSYTIRPRTIGASLFYRH